MNITDSDKAVIDRVYDQYRNSPTFWFTSAGSWALGAGVLLAPIHAEPSKVATALGWMCAGIALARLGQLFTALMQREARG